MKSAITREFHAGRIVTLAPGEVFVFGSNEAGIHGAGAALHARQNFGAELRVGAGPTGRCYALPTKDAKLKTLPLAEIARHAQRFIAHAAANPDTRFLLTAVGCGLAGLRTEEIAPLFVGAPGNVVFPPEFEGMPGADVSLATVDWPSQAQWPEHFPTSRRFSVEPHGDGFAIYQGRDGFHHGLNLGQLSECHPAMAERIEQALNAAATGAEGEIWWREPAPGKRFLSNVDVVFDGIDTTGWQREVIPTSAGFGRKPAVIAEAVLERPTLAEGVPFTRPAGTALDTQRMDAIASEYWTLDCFDMPTIGGDDADVGWRVISHHRDAPRHRVVAQVYADDPRAALDAALAAPTDERARPRADAPDSCWIDIPDFLRRGDA